MDGLELACRDPALHGIDSKKITFYSRRIMVVASGKVPGMAVWRERLFAAVHLNANLPAAYFGVPTDQVVEVGLEVGKGVQTGAHRRAADSELPCGREVTSLSQAPMAIFR
jgi:hypothetical protein